MSPGSLGSLERYQDRSPGALATAAVVLGAVLLLAGAGVFAFGTRPMLQGPLALKLLLVAVLAAASAHARSDRSERALAARVVRGALRAVLPLLVCVGAAMLARDLLRLVLLIADPPL